jgi:PAS domain S-box-containing protein
MLRGLRHINTNTEMAPSSAELEHFLIDSAKDYAIFMLDSQGYVRTWNTGAQRIKGYSPNEIIGKHFSTFYTAEDQARDKHHDALRIALDTGKYEEDGWRVRKDGSKFQANVVIRPLKDDSGHHRGFVKITRDLTERFRAQELIQNFFRLPLDLLAIADPSGYFLRLNPAWDEMTGYTEAELTSKPYLEFVHPDDRERTASAAARLSAGHATESFENRYLCRDGSYRQLIWKAAASADGSLFYGAARDVTDEKKAAVAVAELNTELTRRNSELEALNKELESFSYSISHDLRSPLRSLDGFSQALLEDYQDDMDEEGRDFLRRIRAASQQMGQLIDDLLQLARLSRLEMKREKVDLSSVAREVIADLRDQDPARQAECTIQDGLIAQGDPQLLRIVLTNLIQNAWKFSQKKPWTIIEVGSTQIDGAQAFFVRDNGAGFDMKYTGKLFGAFQRLHSKQEFPGNGIGLATVQRIVQKHGGRIWPQSKVDEGATFFFTCN